MSKAQAQAKARTILGRRYKYELMVLYELEKAKILSGEKPIKGSFYPVARARALTVLMQQHPEEYSELYAAIKKYPDRYRDRGGNE